MRPDHGANTTTQPGRAHHQAERAAQMTPTETRTLMQALRNSDHAFLGIRPADATPAEAPCIVLQGATANDLSYALVTAGQHWPECTEWNLIGSDEELSIAQPWNADGTPSDLRALRMPDTLASFETGA